MVVAHNRFTSEVVDISWGFSEGNCQCRKIEHDHIKGRCNRHLSWEMRGYSGAEGWEALPIDNNLTDRTMANCQILCSDCQGR